MTSLSFFGAAGTVTGSCSMVEIGPIRFLVDCGMFQGNKTVRALNEEPFPFNAEKIDFVILTHAHIDHSGLLPKLAKHGFRGKIFATPASLDLLSFMIMDSAKIVTSNAERENRKRAHRGKDPIEPLYSEDDARQVLELLTPVEYDNWTTPGQDISFRFWNAGHMLGSASAEVKAPDTETGNQLRLLFSGDIGPEEKVFHPEPGGEQGFDYIICESTYGDRNRDDYTLLERRKALKAELTRGLGRGGNIVIPCFAVERSQELLHDIGVLLATGQIPETTVFLDSPLASKVTEVFKKYAGELQDVELQASQLFNDHRFRITQSVEESKALNNITSGAIIISASGMADAGRIQHHLKNNIWRGQATVLFVGYQAPGSLGSVITSGKKRIRIHGKEFHVRADIRRLGNYSAHADQDELFEWVTERGPVVGRIFLNHGDDDAREVFKKRLADSGIAAHKIHLPQFDESYDLKAGTAQSKGRMPERIKSEDIKTDWHNDYAQFMVSLSEKLEQQKTGADRRKLINTLNDLLEQNE